MILIQAINNSFLLKNSQKKYLIKKLKNSDKLYKNKLLEILKSEKRFILKLLKKYKTDKNNTAIGQMKGELIHKNFEKIKKLENNDKDDLKELEKKLEL